MTSFTSVSALKFTASLCGSTSSECVVALLCDVTPPPAFLAVLAAAGCREAPAGTFPAPITAPLFFSISLPPPPPPPVVVAAAAGPFFGPRWVGNDIPPPPPLDAGVSTVEHLFSPLPPSPLEQGGFFGAAAEEANVGVVKPGEGPILVVLPLSPPTLDRYNRLLFIGVSPDATTLLPPLPAPSSTGPSSFSARLWWFFSPSCAEEEGSGGLCSSCTLFLVDTAAAPFTRLVF